ncbi:MAG: peptidylprolyl isomerase [Dehalococcoidia bacterium]|jgi:peptidylprolyl isomerase
MKKFAVIIGILLLTALLITGCGEGEPTGATVGDRVTVNYTGYLDDGTIFDTSYDGEPLSFVIGDGSMISGFDTAVRGMQVGETKTVIIPAASAYGEYREDLVVVLSLDEFEEGVEVGDRVQLQNVTSGETMYFTVIDISDSEVTLDGNHPLAGEDLTFEIELVAIE